MSTVAEKLTQYYLDPANLADVAEKKTLFLKGLQDTGTVLHAAELADIHRNTAYLWRQIDPEFKAAWDAALEDATDVVERSLYRQAISEKNIVATIFYLKHNRAKYREETRIIVAKEVDETIDRAIAAHQLPTSLEPVDAIDTPTLTGELDHMAQIDQLGE